MPSSSRGPRPPKDSKQVLVGTNGPLLDSARLNETIPRRPRRPSGVVAADWDNAQVTAPNAIPVVPVHNLRPTLSILSSSVHPSVDVLVERTLRIGRDASNDIRLPGDRSMSRHHAIIIPTLEGLFVEDGGSTNGTFVNGVRIKRAPLNHNDRLRLGETMIQVRYEPIPDVSAEAPPSSNTSRGSQGELLRAWRKQQGLSQAELATILGVSQRTVSLWEQGAQISPENLKNLRDKAGCNLL